MIKYILMFAKGGEDVKTIHAISESEALEFIRDHVSTGYILFEVITVRPKE